MDKDKLGYKEGVVSIIVNTLLFGLKLWAGIVSGSIALVADAWHTLSDSLSSVIVIFGIKLSSKKPDKEHPFGHGRWQYIASIFIAFLLGLIAYDFLRDSILQFNNKQSANFGTLAIVVTVISILLKEGLARYAFFLAKKTGNISIKADGWHHRTDALSSVIVLVGILFGRVYWWVDSVLGVVIALMLFYAAYEIIKESIDKILGEEPNEELITKLKQLIKSIYPEDFNVHHFHIHNYVHHQELTFHIKVKNDMNILDAHNISTRIEKAIKNELNISSTIHIEPLDHIHE